jgi:uncharacterized protein YecT (DUF1311 family)
MTPPRWLRASLLAIALFVADPARSAGPSFDCAKATTPDEKLVCANPRLAGLDARMGRVYALLKAQLRGTPAERALGKSQAEWMKERRGCTGADAPRGRAAACAEEQYLRRLLDLEDDLLVAPPGGALTARSGKAANTAVTVDVAWPALSAASPGAAAFNAFFEKRARDLLDQVGSLTPAEAEADAPEPGMEPSSTLQRVSVPWASARAVSVRIYVSEYTGGAHPNGGYATVTWDLARGRPLTADELFAGEGWQKAVAALVAAELARLPEEIFFEEARGAFAGKVLDLVGDPGAWTFMGDEAVLILPRYLLAPYAAGDLSVRLTFEQLKPWLRDGGALLR